MRGAASAGGGARGAGAALRGGWEKQGFPNFTMALEPDRMNLGSALREAGYATGWVGKFHVESELEFPEFFQGADGFQKIAKTANAGKRVIFPSDDDSEKPAPPESRKGERKKGQATDARERPPLSTPRRACH